MCEGDPGDAQVGDACDPGDPDCQMDLKCSPWDVDDDGFVEDSQCVDIIGCEPLGAACTRQDDNDDCAPGLFCMTESSGGMGQGVCVGLCDVDQPESCDGVCEGFNMGDFPVCLPNCDPLAPDCPGQHACYALEDEFVCWVPGESTGSCNQFNACEAGMFCLPEAGFDCMGETCCYSVCDVSNGNADCVMGLACHAIDGDVGYCDD
jgi:hypothetical protein